MALFLRTKKLEARVDNFFDQAVKAGMIYQRAINIYLKHAANDEFDACLKQIQVTENQCDQLRRKVEIDLYSHALIPEARGDVLELLEDVDKLVNYMEANLFRFSIQMPIIDEAFKDGFAELTDVVEKAVEMLIVSARAFFRDFQSVRDHNNKVLFYESEADRVSTKLQRLIFSSELSLEQRRHLVYFVEKIDELANLSEDIADKLVIFAIKRKI